MLQPAPASAICAHHPGLTAAWICPRCGSFFCRECERRTRPDAVPMCPDCWELRGRTVGPASVSKPSTALQTAGLVLGFFALLPLPAVQIAALVVSIMGIVKAKEPPQSNVRWRPIVGLVLAFMGVGVDVLVFTLK